MCCLLTTLVIFGPRLAVLVWWLLQPARFNLTFNTFIWPLLGLIFLPWTLMMYIIVAPGGIVSFDWVWLALALAVDIFSYAGGGYGNRDRIPGMS